jgi:hypothetical protein
MAGLQYVSPPLARCVAVFNARGSSLVLLQYFGTLELATLGDIWILRSVNRSSCAIVLLQPEETTRID